MSQNQVCEHDWVFLRALPTREVGYRLWANADVFYCRKCLEYRTVEKEGR